MKNTIALAAVILGSGLLYAGITGKALSNVLRMALGQEEIPGLNLPLDGSGIQGTAVANGKDRPGYKEDQLAHDADGKILRDDDGWAILIPGAVPFDPSKVVPKPGA